jgi:hypothetical protein
MLSLGATCSGGAEWWLRGERPEEGTAPPMDRGFVLSEGPKTAEQPEDDDDQQHQAQDTT